MHIGIAGPVQIMELLKQVNPKADCPYNGLGGTPVTRLIQQLWKRGHQISVYTLDKSLSPGKLEVIEQDRIKIYIGCYRHQHRMRNIFKDERDALKQAILEDDAPFINAHWSYEFAMAAIESGKPHIITCRDEPLTILRLQTSLYRFGRLFMAWWVFRHGENFIANSPYLAKSLGMWGIKPAFVIPNFIDENWLTDEKQGINNRYHKIIAINNGWSKLKNVKAAIRAFQIIKQQYTDLEFDLYGTDFGPGEKAEQWAKARGLQKGINFIGFKPSAYLQEHLKSYRLLLHSSLEESFGMILIEAMASKVPVVAGMSSGAVPWVLDDGKAGVLVDIKDPHAIAMGISQLLSDERYYQNLVDTGYQRVLNSFSADGVVDQYEKAYRSII